MAGNALAMLPWFPRDFIASTRGWPLLHRGVYRELLDAQWELGSLPDDVEELARICGASPEEFKIAWTRVSAKFVPADGGGLINVRLEEHRAKALNIREKRAASGRAGGAASVQAKRQATAQANTQPNAQPNAQTNAAASVEANFNPPSPSPSPSSLSLRSREGASKIDASDGKAGLNGKKSDVHGTPKRPLRRCPPEFVVADDQVTWAERECPGVDLYRETQKFRDHTFRTPHTDWPAAWRNWIRRAYDTLPPDRIAPHAAARR